MASLSQIECVLINELIPHIDGNYKTKKNRDSRMISGFSMGGNMAFYFAVKYPESFSAVTCYAATFHHLYNKEYLTVGVHADKIPKMYERMLKEKWYLEDGNILNLVRQNADKIRGKLKIELYVGTNDILLCDNTIMHLYLESLDILHKYREFNGTDHDLERIIFFLDSEQFDG